MTKGLEGLIALGLVLAAGIGGSLGSVALGQPDLATPILSFAGGLLGGLLLPQVGRAPGEAGE